MDKRELLHISEVAGLLGTSANAIRYYHEVGLLPEPERTESGYRLYGAEDVLALRRIRWLRSLGLPVRQTQRVMENPDEPALREALADLEEEMTARITGLVAQREKIQGILEHGDLSDLPGEPEGSLPDTQKEAEWRAIVEKMESEYPLSPEEEDLKRLLERALSFFRWPSGIRTMFDDFAHQIRHISKEDPEQWRESYAAGVELSRRFAALRKAPEDSSEVDRLVGDFIGYERRYPLEPELEATWRRHENTIENPIFRLAIKLVLKTFSPAQRRFIVELESRAQDPWQVTGRKHREGALGMAEKGEQSDGAD